MLAERRQLILFPESGMSTVGRVLAWVVLIPIVVLVAGIGGCEARKAYYDSQVREMCEKDGGVTVFERVALSRDQYRELGGSEGSIPVYAPSSEHPNEPYFTETKTVYMREANPEIRRDDVLFKRRSDNVVLARFIYYARIGGDFPTLLAHRSSKGCAQTGPSVSAQIFQIDGATK